MSKEVLFKAKRKDNKEWVEGYIIKSSISDTYYMATTEDTSKHYFESKPLPEVIPETICQYIAETDSNGKKLFWNDEIVVPELNFRKIIIDNKGVFYIIQNFIEHGTDFYYLRNIFDKEVK